MSNTYPEESLPPDDDLTEDEPSPRNIDPALAYIILLIVVLIGLRGMAIDVRYTLIWTASALVAILALLVDHIEIARPRATDPIIGVIVGAIVGLPLLIIGASALSTLSSDLFAKTSDTAIFQMLAFTMPLAETLFFRGALQASRGTIVTGIAASVWAIALFFPQINIQTYPFVAVIIGLFFVFVNFLYSYMRGRFGIMSAWACQITINLLLLFVVRFVS